MCVPRFLSCVQLSATLCVIAHQAPVSKGFSRQEYWSGLPCPPPGEPSQPRDRMCHLGSTEDLTYRILILKSDFERSEFLKSLYMF